MESLYLYVKDGTGINLNSVVLQNIFCQTDLILVLDVHELLLGFLVIRIDLKPADLGKVCDPLGTCMGGHPVRKKRIAVKQKAPLGNTVGLVIELLREHLIKVLQFLILQNFGVKPCNTVYGIAGCNSQMRHLYLTVIDDRHLAHLLMVAGIFFLNLQNKSAVNFFNNLINSGKQS